jgi:hypothetical protein
MFALCLICASTAGLAQDPNVCDQPGEQPDLILGNLTSVVRFGTLNGLTSYSLGSISCNIGSCWVDWFATTAEHPVFTQNLFRLSNGRFEQLGQSWVSHRFLALSSAVCSPDCLPTNGTHLGVDCSTDNSPNINGAQQYMGPRSEVNPATGDFAFPFSGQNETGDVLFKRLQARNADLDPMLNPGALYFIEGQSVAADDAAAGNQNNDATYRQVGVNGAGETFSLFMIGASVSERPAIFAWGANEPGVQLVPVDVPGDGRFLVGSRVTDLGGGLWHYEYAVQNLGSNRAAMRFEVPLPAGTGVSGVGFHDVDYHSGEPYDDTDWSFVVESDSGVWATQSFAENPNANALRWGTLYNFRFDAASPPVDGNLTLGLYLPGIPAEVLVPGVVPADCGNASALEVDCTDGTDDDCDGLVDCADPDCCGGGACPGNDGDNDTHLDCADCDDTNSLVWARPGEAQNLLLARNGLETLLSWDPPLEPGGAIVSYDVLRSTDVADFVHATSCLSAPDPAATTAIESDAPVSEELYCYLVRPQNDCPDGLGPTGHGQGGSCP